MLIGYARAHHHDPAAGAQKAELEDAGCSVVYSDEDPTGASRRQLAAALAAAREGDVLMVSSLNRLSRTLPSLIELVHNLLERGVGLRALTEGIETTGSKAGPAAHLLMALASFERIALTERTQAGLNSARQKGTKLGRRPKLTSDKVELARRLIEAGDSPSTAARAVGVSTATLYRAIPGGASSRTPIDLFSELV